MVRISLTAAALFVASSASVLAATVDGKLVSIDAVARTVTLESGAMLNLAEYVVMEGLEPGQVIRITYNDETIDATAVDILEYNPPIEVTTLPEEVTETPVVESDVPPVETSDVPDVPTEQLTDSPQTEADPIAEVIQ